MKGSEYMADPIYFGHVIADKVLVYNSANTNDVIKNKYLSKGNNLTIYDQYINGTQVWVRHAAGWSIASSIESGQSIQIRFLKEKNNLYGLTENTPVATTNTTKTNTTNNITKPITEKTTSKTVKSNKTMRLFGSPFQFNEYTDHRLPSISDFFGKKYAERVVAHAPYITIIPGDAEYLGGESKSKKEEDSAIILKKIFAEDSVDGGNSDDDSDNADNTEQTRYYNFKQNYIGYINKVNLTLRTMAVMLGLGNVGIPVYEMVEDEKEHKTKLTVKHVALSEYNWADYRWDANNYSLMKEFKAAKFGESGGGDLSDFAKDIGTSIISRTSEANIVFSRIFGWSTGPDESEETLDTDKLSNVWNTRNYIQFYVDPTATDASDGMTNTTQDSKLKDIFANNQSSIKEMAFIAHTSGIDTSAFSKASSNALDEAMSTFAGANGGSGLKGIFGRVIQAAGNVLNGENMIFPEVYQYSSRDSSSRQFRINLYSPYGTPLSIFLNILVPIGFLLCLTAPANKSANSYEAPPLVKVFYDGVYSCSLGIIESLRITRDSADWTADGLPTSAVVDMTVKDLYSDLSVNSAAEDTELFLHNSSLIEFLFTQCGMSMISYNANYKAMMRWNTDRQLADSKFDAVAGRLSENMLSDIIDKFRRII